MWIGGRLPRRIRAGGARRCIRFAASRPVAKATAPSRFELRKALKKFGIEPTGDLFDRAYAYVAEHY